MSFHSSKRIPGFSQSFISIKNIRNIHNSHIESRWKSKPQQRSKTISFIKFNKQQASEHRAENKLLKAKEKAIKTQERIQSAQAKKTLIVAKTHCRTMLMSRKYEITKYMREMNKFKDKQKRKKNRFYAIWFIIIRLFRMLDNTVSEVREIKAERTALENYFKRITKIEMMLKSWCQRSVNKARNDLIRARDGIALSGGLLRPKVANTAKGLLGSFLVRISKPVVIVARFQRTYRISKVFFGS